MSAPLDPNWKPLANASQEAREAIWTKILEFAMSSLSPGTSLVNPAQQPPVTWRRFRAGLVRVCKELNRLGTPLLYEVVILARTQTISKLNASPHKGHVKEIWLQQNETIFTGRRIRSVPLDTEQLADLVSSCNELVIVSQAKSWGLQDRDAGPMPSLWNEEEPGVTLPVRALVSLSEHSAGTLRHLNVGFRFKPTSEDIDEDPDEELTQAIQALGRFRELRSLTLCTGGYYPIKAREVDVNLPPDAFAKVEQLRMTNNSLLNSSIMEVLAGAGLPSISRAIIRAAGYGGHDLVDIVSPFFTTHGHKIAFLDAPSILAQTLDALDNLTEWEIGPNHNGAYDLDFLDILEEEDNHTGMPKLKSIKFRSHSLDSLAKKFSNVDFTRFEALETIQISGGLVWPTNQRDIDKSAWVKIAERMLEEQNIKLLDRNRKAWIPRLKPATASRSRKK